MTDALCGHSSRSHRSQIQSHMESTVTSCLLPTSRRQTFHIDHDLQPDDPAVLFYGTEFVTRRSTFSIKGLPRACGEVFRRSRRSSVETAETDYAHASIWPTCLLRTFHRLRIFEFGPMLELVRVLELCACWCEEDGA